MGLLDNNLEIDLLAMLADRYMKYKSKVMVKMPGREDIMKYMGVIGEVDDDMVMTSRVEFGDNVIYHQHYWISRNNPKYAKSSYSAKRGQYSCEYSGGQPVTPDYIIRWMNVWNQVYEF